MTSEELKRRTEQIIAERPERIHEIPAREIHDLIYELHEYQARLEKENNELNKVHEHIDQLLEDRTDAFRKSEADYRKLVQNANSIIYRRDPQGHITFFNEYAQTFFGYSNEEIMGKHVVGTIVPEIDSNGRDLAAMIEDISRHPDQYTSNINENIRRDKERVWISWTNKAIIDESGNVREILCVGNDITALRKADEALRKSEERYQALVENIGIGISLISPDMRILSLNRQMREWCPAIDINEHPLCYRSFNDPPRDEICSYCPTYPALRDGMVHEAITETPKGDTTRNYRIVASPIKDENGTVTAAIEMVEDITEKLELHEQLALSEKFYETFFETMGAGMVVIEEDMTLSLVNKEFARITGYGKEELQGRSWAEFIAHQDLDMMKTYHHQRRIDPHSVPSVYRCSLVDIHGIERDIVLSVSMIPGTNKSVASFLDVSEEVRLKKDLIEQEQRYRLLADNVSDVIWTADLYLHFNYVSPSVERLLGYNPDEILYHPMDEIFSPASRETVLNLGEKFRDIVKGIDDRKRLAGSQTIELDLISKDGTPVWTETTMTFIGGSENCADMILGVTRDITKRKKAEEERWKSENLYHLLFDSSPAGIFYYDTQLRFIDCNDRFTSVIQSGRDRLIGLDLKTLVDQSIVPALSEALHGRNGFFEGSYRTTVSQVDMWTILQTAPLYDIDGTVTGGMGIMENTTERVMAKQALEKSKAELEVKSRFLEESNTTLKVLMNRIEEDKMELQENVLVNIRHLIIPLIEKIKVSPSKTEIDGCVEVLESSLNNIVSPFLRNISLKHYHLTPKEMQVASLVKEGKTTKEIAGLMNVSLRSVEVHRDNIRGKLDIKHKKANLQSVLLSMS
ncbi:MAG TPA: PAS domain S-box protein [Deltaproteobacteria bacterium]|nr:PAS domain S-box protein [Deltaproteobacteria bacterium]